MGGGHSIEEFVMGYPDFYPNGSWLKFFFCPFSAVKIINCLFS